uniref:Ataxin 7 like 3 n=1 Tax=Cairina moschata TaxID=8855 RepID=A0A8C3CEL2_CAIMO
MKMEDLPGSGLENSKLEAVAHEIYAELVEDACLGLCFEVHRAVKCGYFFLDDTDPDSTKDFGGGGQGSGGQGTWGQGFGDWGHRNGALQDTDRALGTGGHKERALGTKGHSFGAWGHRGGALGTRRHEDGALGTRGSGFGAWDGAPGMGLWGTQGQGFGDWGHGDRALRDTDRALGSGGHKERVLGTRGHAFGVLGGPPTSHPPLSPQQCGVISEHTKKMCTRSLRCPQHTDEQRRAVRVYLLGPSASLPESEAGADADGFDVAESQALMSRLQWDGASDISPSDSASSKASECVWGGTNNSESRKTKKKKPHLGLVSGGGAPPGLGSSKKKKPKPPPPHPPSIYDDIN